MSNRQIRTALDGIAASTTKLNQKCDAATAILKRADEELQKLSVGVVASVAMNDGALLVYERFGGHFQICVVLDEGSQDDEGRWLTIAELRRDERLEALENLPALLQEIQKKVDAMVVEAEQALEAVNPPPAEACG